MSLRSDYKKPVYVLYTYLSEPAFRESFSYYLSLSSKRFKQKLRRFRRWQDAQASLFGRLLLKTGLKKFYGVEISDSSIKEDAYGRPFLVGPGLDFNITHSGSLVACAIAQNQRIGIDLEEIGSIPISDFRSQMTEGEWNRVALSKEKLKAFFTYWTQKEAVIKASGEGLSVALNSFEVKENRARLNGHIWHVRELAMDESYICHLASCGNNFECVTTCIKSFSS